MKGRVAHTFWSREERQKQRGRIGGQEQERARGGEWCVYVPAGPLSQITVISRTGPDWDQVPGTLSGSLKWVLGAQILGVSCAPFSGTYTETGSEAVELGLEPAFLYMMLAL